MGKTGRPVVDGKARRMSNEQLGELTRRVDDLKRRVNQGYVPFDWAIRNIQRTSQREEAEHLRLVNEKPLVLDGINGGERLANAGNVFQRISPEFQKIDSCPRLLRSRSYVNVHKIVGDVPVAQLFYSLSLDLGKVCLTQGQIWNFAKKHSEQFSTGGLTYFLLELGLRFQVVWVSVSSDLMGKKSFELATSTHKISSTMKTTGSFGFRLVAPVLQQD